MPVPILEISNLTKKYGNFVAVDGFNLELQQGTVHGLVGPNGAGKSTMISIISGLRRKTSGAINFGVPRKEIMLMPDTPEFFERHPTPLGRNIAATDPVNRRRGLI